MKHQADTLLPLGEKGRDEGMPAPSAVFVWKHGVGAARCVITGTRLRSKDSLEQPLTPFPLSPKGRGE
jgi:hypothetical protein